MIVVAVESTVLASALIISTSFVSRQISQVSWSVVGVGGMMGCGEVGR